MNKTQNTILRLFIVATVALAAFAFTGCSGNSAPTDNPASPTGDINGDLAFELFTKVAASELLDGDKDKAETVVMVADLILDGIGSGELAIPAQVDAAIKELVLSTDLEASSKQAVLILADSLKSHYLARIDAGQLDPTITAPLATIVGWVRDAAQDTILYGAPQTYGAPPIAELGATEATMIATFLAKYVYFWVQDKKAERAEHTALAPEPLDLSLWGWLTSPRTRASYPLFGPEPARIDPKFETGARHMLANPLPLDPEMEAYFATREF